MKKAGFLLILVFAIFSLQAQNEADTVKPWTTGANMSLSFSQSALSNWTAGGENALALNSYINWFGDYAKGKSIWRTG